LRTVLLGIIFTLQANSFDVDTASKIFNKIFTAIFPSQVVRVYTPSSEYYEVIQKAKKLTLVHTSNSADISLITSLKELYSREHQLIFTTEISVLRSSQNSIGAFYWEYGRPKIIFIKPRLDKHNIKLPKNFHKYIVKDVP